MNFMNPMSVTVLQILMWAKRINDEDCNGENVKWKNYL